MFPAEVPKRLPDNEDTRELPKPSMAPIYSLCRKTQWGSVALNIKLIERTAKRLCMGDFTGFWGINLHQIMHYVKLLNYNTKLLFISMSATRRIVFVSCRDVSSSASLFYSSISRFVTNGFTLHPDRNKEADQITVQTISSP